MSENPMMKRAQCAMVEGGALLWRNNVGVFIQGKQRQVKESGVIRCANGTIKVNEGDVIIFRPRRIKCGLDNGSSDLIGITPVMVTQAMVGKTIAVFTSTEAKDEGKEPSQEQREWIEMVNGYGGIAFAFHTEDEARNLLVSHTQRITT